MPYIINFIHDEKAIYPTIRGYRHFFSNHYEIRETSLRQYPRQGDPARSVLWFMMGFYPFRAPPASVGPLAPLKDSLKALCNFKPDLRIVRNEVMAQTIGFKDDVPQLYVGMGVSPTLVARAERPAPGSPEFDFVYIGAITKDRRLDALIESFVRRYPRGRRLLPIGPAERSIVREFMGQENVVFKGRLTPSETFDPVMTSPRHPNRKRSKGARARIPAPSLGRT